MVAVRETVFDWETKRLFWKWLLTEGGRLREVVATRGDCILIKTKPVDLLSYSRKGAFYYFLLAWIRILDREANTCVRSSFSPARVFCILVPTAHNPCAQHYEFWCWCCPKWLLPLRRCENGVVNTLRLQNAHRYPLFFKHIGGGVEWRLYIASFHVITPDSR